MQIAVLHVLEKAGDGEIAVVAELETRPVGLQLALDHRKDRTHFVVSAIEPRLDHVPHKAGHPGVGQPLRIRTGNVAWAGCVEAVDQWRHSNRTNRSLASIWSPGLTVTSATTPSASA